MKVMFKKNFKNMGYCWHMSDIVKNSLFIFEGKRLYNIMNTRQMFCSLVLLGSLQETAVSPSRKLANVIELMGRVFEL